MKYLFFDIECSNCFQGIGKICEFGYVLTDENFNILRKNEFVMSPGKGKLNRFHLTGRKNQKDLILSYDYDYYYSQPQFPCFYEKIKNLMEDKDTICFAWSSDNDMLHLFHTCQRYKKEPFKYICYDIQKLGEKFLNIDSQISLKTACILIAGKSSVISLQEHLSSDDAKMTMLIFQAICALENKKSSLILEESKYASDDSRDLAAKEKRRQEVKRAHDLYKSIVKNDMEHLYDVAYKKYTFSVATKLNVKNLEELIDIVHSKNGILVNGIRNADYFVVFNNDEKIEIESKLKEEYTGTYILVSDISRF